MTNLVFCLMGPTASGKSNLALELVTQFPFEIISVDSALIYQKMDIGTAKLSNEALLRVPHHLINIRTPIESYSVATFCKEAIGLMKLVISKGKIPLLVGGTMMYFKALQDGLSLLPEQDKALRQTLLEKANRLGWEALHQELSDLDPISASRIHSHDRQRIQRALEVYYLTGSSLSEHMVKSKILCPYSYGNIILFPHKRSWLHERIEKRFDTMLDEGLIEEVKALMAMWDLHSQHPSMRCVGYRQVLEYLQGVLSYKAMREKGIAATRQLAKRQLTWLRHWNNAFYFDPQETSSKTQIIAKIKELLDNNERIP